MNRKLCILLMMVFFSLCASAQGEKDRQQVLIETSMGDIRVELYNETPLHRDNFLKLVKEGFYDGILWHRVIRNFMIQTGDSTTRHAKPGDFWDALYLAYLFL